MLNNWIEHIFEVNPSTNVDQLQTIEINTFDKRTFGFHFKLSTDCCLFADVSQSASRISSSVLLILVLRSIVIDKSGKNK